MNIGERIRKCRENLDMTQEELALKLGYKSRSSVNKVENSRELSIKKVRDYLLAVQRAILEDERFRSLLVYYDVDPQ